MALDMQDIGQAIYETAKRIEKGTNELYKHAKAYAEAGNIAELKYKRDLAEVSYKTARDMLESLRAELSGLQSIYKNQGEV